MSLKDTAVAQLTLARFREFLREPEAVFWVFIFPILLTAGLGIAFRSREPEPARVGVPRSAAGAEALAASLKSAPGVIVELLDDSAAALALRSAKVAVLAVPDGEGGVEYRFDPSRPDARAARLGVDVAVQRAAGRADPVAAGERHVREHGARYVDFVVPGLLGMNLMGSGIWGIGFAIVDARRKKLLKRLVATPMSKSAYLGSFLLHRIALLVVEVVAVLGFAALAFDVPVRGSLATLALVCLLGSLAFGALGLLVASRARTMEGASGLMNLVMLPMWVLSGVFFSSSNFPDAIQPAIQALPLTAVNDALRANMLEGAGLAALGGELAIIGGWLVVCFVVALRLFRWR